VKRNSREKVIKHVWSVVQPRIYADGFSRIAGANAYRDHDRTIDVLSMEFFDAATHRTWGTTPHSFGLSSGVFLKFAPNPFGGQIPEDAQGNSQPDVTVCALRSHLLSGLPHLKTVPRNVWSVKDDLSDIEAVSRDVAQSVEHTGRVWFERFREVAQEIRTRR
jgi:hypothetical protein